MQEWFLQKPVHRQRSSMPNANTRSRKPAVAAVVAILLACLGLAACGSSSSSTTSSSANAASTGAASGTSSTGSTSTTPGAPGRGRGSARFAAMRECLQKNGITLPKRTPGSRPGGGFVPGAGAGGGPQLPSGVTRAQYEAALKKCGGGSGHFFRGGAARPAQQSRLQGSARQVRRLFAPERHQPAGAEHLGQWPDLRHEGDQHRQLPVQDRFGEVP